MISFRIWLALLRPFVAHPLFQRWGIWTPPPPLIKLRGGSIIQRWRAFYRRYEARLLIGGSLLFVVMVVLVGFWTMLGVLIIIPMIIGAVTIPLVMLFSGTVSGLLTGFAVSDTIINEKLQGRFDLLGLTPYGFAGATWALCSLSLQSNDLLRRVRGVMRVFFSFLIALVTIPLLYTIMLVLASPRSPIGDVLSDMVLILLVVGAMTIDYIQSTSVGALIGMIAPLRSSTRFESRNNVWSSFLVSQVASYLIAVFLIGFILPNLLATVGITSQLGYVALAVVVFYLIRELVLVLMWQLLAYQLRVELDELDQLTHVGLNNQSGWVRLSGLIARLIFRWRFA